MQVLSLAITLFFVLDPFGNLPIVLSLLNKVEESRRWKVVLRESLIALFLLVLFYAVGPQFISLLGVGPDDLTICGGVVLGIIALRLVFPDERANSAKEQEAEPFIVPLAIPLVAGPSTLTTVLLFTLQDPGRLPLWAGVVGAAWLINAFILGGLSGWLSRLLGPRGLLAMEKLMGMILVTISVQMIMTGLKKFIAG